MKPEAAIKLILAEHRRIAATPCSGQAGERIDRGFGLVAAAKSALEAAFKYEQYGDAATLSQRSAYLAALALELLITLPDSGD